MTGCGRRQRSRPLVVSRRGSGCSDIDQISLRITARADDRPDQGGAQVLYCHSACLEATGCRDLEVTNPDYWR